MILLKTDPFCIGSRAASNADRGSWSRYAWNTIANVLFLESPANVGYSYCDEPACRWDDKTGAEANYGALLEFFEKFPEYKDNEFYITGESCEPTHPPRPTPCLPTFGQLTCWLDATAGCCR